MGADPGASPPPVWDITARAKWNAWAEAILAWKQRIEKEDDQDLIDVTAYGQYEYIAYTLKLLQNRATNQPPSSDGLPPLGNGVSSQPCQPPDDEDMDNGDVGQQLVASVLRGDKEQVQTLLGGSGVKWVNHKDAHGLSLLHMATDRGHVDILEVRT